MKDGREKQRSRGGRSECGEGNRGAKEVRWRDRGWEGEENVVRRV